MMREAKNTLVTMIHSGANARSAEIHFMPEWDEYTVKFFKDGAYCGCDADYFTDSLEDAKDCARFHCGIKRVPAKVAA